MGASDSFDALFAACAFAALAVAAFEGAAAGLRARPVAGFTGGADAFASAPADDDDDADVEAEAAAAVESVAGTRRTRRVAARAGTAPDSATSKARTGDDDR